MTDDARTPREVAEELGVTVRTVQRWIAAGRLSADRVGGRLRISRSSLSSIRATTRATTAAEGGPAHPIRTLLIANRGEIAGRIARTARRLGMRVVGVVAPDDHPPRDVDELVPVPGYLDIDALVDAAHRVAADAIHPGYGFGAENPEFAAATLRAGLIWVGPPPEAMAAMGDKAAARRSAAALGVPVLPGYDGDAQDDATLRAEAQRVGLPLLIKPSGGGGGKGMRVVRSGDSLDEALAASRREAKRSFGDERLILERMLVGPRHVEIQVLFDGSGAGVHLGERDCSVQRRNQKIVEEAPGPAVTPELRERMGAAALAIAGAAGYVNAGTVEFLLDDAGGFSFLEMNTRLQVEHPVTELVTGRDLVADQLRIAAGEALAIAQERVAWHGHAIEARLYAEDPDAGFLPATGRLRSVRWPRGVRVDAGYEANDAVSDRYDPLLAKIIAHGQTRAQALDRLGIALGETEVLGVRTNLRFLRRLIADPLVRDGEVRTDSLADVALPPPPQPTERDWAAAAAGLLAAEPRGAWSGGWRANAPASVRLRFGTEERRVAVSPDVEPATVVAGGTAFVDVEGQSLELELAPPPSVEEAVRHAVTHAAGHAALTAPMPGRVIAVRAAEGAHVRAHQVVVVIEAMKMEHAVVSPLDGTLSRLHVTEGQQVQRGDLLAEVSA